MTDELKTAADSSYDPVKDPLHPLGKGCSICGASYSDDDWGVLGWIGILPVSFCPDCDQGIFNMVYSLSSVEDLELLLNDKKEEEAKKDSAS
jgi:hypothetical protein